MTRSETQMRVSFLQSINFILQEPIRCALKWPSVHWHVAEPETFEGRTHVTPELHSVSISETFAS